MLLASRRAPGVLSRFSHRRPAAAASSSGVRSAAVCWQQRDHHQQQQTTGKRLLHMSAAAAAGEGAAAAPPASAAPAPAVTPAGADDDPIVQWVVLRRDLWQELGWPLGPVIAQACHASSAAMFSTLQDAATQAYVQPANLDHMHKVVLEVKSEQQLVSLSKKLEAEGVQHKLWVEQPENYPTCLATKPYRRSDVGGHFKKLQLCKAALARAAKQ